MQTKKTSVTTIAIGGLFSLDRDANTSLIFTVTEQRVGHTLYRLADGEFVLWHYHKNPDMLVYPVAEYTALIEQQTLLLCGIVRYKHLATMYLLKFNDLETGHSAEQRELFQFQCEQCEAIKLLLVEELDSLTLASCLQAAPCGSVAALNPAGTPATLLPKPRKQP